MDFAEGMQNWAVNGLFEVKSGSAVLYAYKRVGGVLEYDYNLHQSSKSYEDACKFDAL